MASARSRRKRGKPVPSRAALKKEPLAQAGPPAAAEKVNTRTRPWYSERRLIFVLYLATVVLHWPLLFPITAVPSVFPDEVHYCITGDNIRWGNGYTMRGQFSGTVPPLVPLFVAATHSLGTHSRLAHFLLSTLIMCAGMFPVYWLARHLKLSVSLSAMVAVAAGMSPCTIYSATYMSESLQYPVLLCAVWMAVRWLEAPCTRASVQLGLVLGTMAMIRYATGTFVIAFSAAALILFVAGLSGQRWTQRLIQFVTVLTIYGAFQIAWWGFKMYHGAGALGAYASNLNTLPYGSVALFGAYIGDAIFAAGPLTAGTLLVGMRSLRRDLPAATVVLGTVTVFLVVTTAIFDGGLTGELRDRFYIYVPPLLCVVSVVGAAAMKTGNRARTFISLLLPAALSAVLVYLYARSRHSLGGSPWAQTFGVLHWPGLGVFRADWMLLWAIAIAAVCSLLIASRRMQPQFVVAASSMALNVGALLVVATLLGRAAESDRATLQPILQAVPPGLPDGSRVAVTGVPAGIGYAASPGRLGIMNRDLGLTFQSIFEVEIMRGLDVRVVDNETELNEQRLGSAFLLTASTFPQLPLLRKSNGFQFYRLERRSVPLVPLREWSIPPASFATQVGALRPDGAIHGTGDKRSGFLVFGPYRALPLGEYEGVFHFRADAGLDYHADIVSGGSLIWSGDLKGGAEAPVHFRIDAPGPVEFRIHGPDREDFVFYGFTLRQF